MAWKSPAVSGILYFHMTSMSGHTFFKMPRIVPAMLAALLISQNGYGNDIAGKDSSPTPIQEVLKNIPVAGAACLKEDFQEKSRKMSVGATRKADPSCAITLEQLTPYLSSSELALVDIRSKTDFDSVRIDGSINLGAAEIKTKRYLANKLVVLIGDGKNDQELYRLCGELKEAGFKQSRVLKGGLLAWLLEHKAVIGRAADVLDLARLTPAELFQASMDADNLIINLSSKLADVLPKAISPSGEGIELVRDLIRTRKKRGVHNIVIVADEQFDKGRLSELAKAARPEPLLIYTGSESAYRQFIHAQDKMWEKQAKGPIRRSCAM